MSYKLKKAMKKNIYKITDLEKDINKEIDKLRYEFFAYEDITDPKSIYKLFDDFKKWVFNFIKQREKEFINKVINETKKNEDNKCFHDMKRYGNGWYCQKCKDVFPDY